MIVSMKLIFYSIQFELFFTNTKLGFLLGVLNTNYGNKGNPAALIEIVRSFIST
jgi:hypothetical protein